MKGLITTHAQLCEMGLTYRTDYSLKAIPIAIQVMRTLVEQQTKVLQIAGC